MNAITRRIAASTALLAAPVLIGLGVASGASADTGSATSTSISASAQHHQTATKATPWQGHSHQQWRHHGQRRVAHQNVFVS
ncbi:hypothetical protein [Mycobacterium sp. ACS4331]|uniref:hypothetical protein n=1 Tax=Mycobacterium sp. ACS4331 TaxID=1834121 RepID=UPI0007FF24BC|nr:hypothetical protein [Mycobacterium sp. ACS4331]OBF25025.1 hypothetical protein A5727_05635 [Mycobacterium sp. ACS4331]